MSLDNNNNQIPQKLNAYNEIDQIDKINKINQISLQVKIHLDYSTDFTYLNLEEGRFIIYTKNEILIFDKKLNFKKLYPSDSDDKYIDIKFVKYIKKRYILLLYDKDLYISTIKSSTILPSKIEKVHNVLNIIELKSGMILTITREDLLEIKINDNNIKVIRLSENPFKNHKLFYRDSSHCIDIFKLSIYELPKNNILISLIIESSELCGTIALY